MNWLRRKYHLDVDVWKIGSTFAKCTICKSLKDLISKVGKNSVSANELKLKGITNIKSCVDVFTTLGKGSPFNQGGFFVDHSW
jgi:hypothetical protein